MTERERILDEAKTCVCGYREQDYGSPENNFRVIAELWTGYLGDTKLNPDSLITPLDVSMMMALLKIARIRSGGGSGDSFVDLAGYAACGGEIFQRENERMPYSGDEKERNMIPPTYVNLQSAYEKIPYTKAMEELKRDDGCFPKGSVVAKCMEQVMKPMFHCKRCKYSDVLVDQSPCNECCFRSGIQTEKYDSKFESVE